MSNGFVKILESWSYNCQMCVKTQKQQGLAQAGVKSKHISSEVS